MLNLIFLLLIGPWLWRQWRRYSNHSEELQAAMLPFADEPLQARRVEAETGLPCLPEHLEQQTTLLG
ncbi:hypothetical protein [Thiopseudomonas denitrificans]|uniref:Uncharacterized protein n=1 Tax=Thiopseudomonas denitrificans TaxID=1501432 RepID=A0A4R6U1D3_9GAMM|nr:hypothetical protein [Thiopseudomonas denitrificans]TDQ38105.1 hypothetical protein DFQ45_10516 [Thiopseudomonas denitrificans]